MRRLLVALSISVIVGSVALADLWSDSTSIEDTELSGKNVAQQAYNHGAAAIIDIYSENVLGTVYHGHLWIKCLALDTLSITSAIVDSARIEMRCSTYAEEGWHPEAAVDAVLLDCHEGNNEDLCPSADTGCNWAKYQCYDASGPCGVCVPGPSLSWTTAGAASVGNDIDISYRAEGYSDWTAAQTWAYFDVTELTKDILDGTISNYGVTVRYDYDSKADSSIAVGVCSSENSSAYSRPTWRIWYTTGAAAVKRVIIID